MKKFITFLFISILMGCSSSEIESVLKANGTYEYASEGKSQITEEEKIIAKVIKLTDGDTIVVNLESNDSRLKQLNNVKIRILSIDTPEKYGEKAKNGPQPFAEEASEQAKDLLLGNNILLELSNQSDPYDNYGRLLANVWLDENTLFQAIMLEKGLARLAYVYEPDTQYLESLLEPAQEKAKNMKIGIWSIDGYVRNNGIYKNN